MKVYRFFPSGYRGCIFGVVILLLAISLTIGTVYYQRTSTGFCQGKLSAGFPAPFICDASGESPLSSVGIINWADLDSVNFLGSFIDILFYGVLLWVIWLIVRRIFHLIILIFLLMTGCAGLSTNTTTQPTIASNTKTPILRDFCHPSETHKLDGLSVTGEYPIWTTITGGQWFAQRLQEPYHEGYIGKGGWYVDKKIQGELRITGQQIDGDGKIFFFSQAQPKKDLFGNEIIGFVDKPTEVLVIDASVSNYQSPIPEGYTGNLTAYILTKPGCYRLIATIKDNKVEIIISAPKE